VAGLESQGGSAAGGAGGTTPRGSIPGRRCSVRNPANARVGASGASLYGAGGAGGAGGNWVVG